MPRGAGSKATPGSPGTSGSRGLGALVSRAALGSSPHSSPLTPCSCQSRLCLGNVPPLGAGVVTWARRDLQPRIPRTKVRVSGAKQYAKTPLTPQHGHRAPKAVGRLAIILEGTLASAGRVC